MILVTGATGQLGRSVIESLLEKGVNANEIIAGARTVEKANDLASKGVNVRSLDYSKPETLTAALEGVDKVLLVSSNNIGNRVGEHKAVVDAAKEAGVKQFVYTSILKADTTPLALGKEHIKTEEDIKKSNIPYTILRNGWYTENYLAALPAVLEHSAYIGSAKEGRISSAARADYAQAAAAVLANSGHENKTYELAGDTSYNLKELAVETSSQTGKEIIYQDLPQEDFRKALLDAGLPEGLAFGLADADVGASNGFLESDSKDLHNLIGRETTSFKDSLKLALK